MRNSRLVRLLFICIIISVSLTYAQSESDTLPPFMDNFCHSAPAPSAQTFFQADLDDEAPSVTIEEAYLAYSTDNWTTKTEISAADLGITGMVTYGADLTNPGSGDVEYYFHFESEDKWAGMYPLYTGTATSGIPDNFMFSCGYDGAGTDSTLPDHEYADDLDILEYWFGMSNDRFYGKIQNATGHWHLDNGSIFSGLELFGYGIAISNPDRPDPDYMFIMAQSGEFTVEVDIRPGVMKAYTATGAEEVNYIGAADIVTTGDILEISAPISTFTSDPDFGGVVSSTGFYQVSAFAMYLAVGAFGSSTEFLFVESTKIGKLYVNNFSSPQAWEYTVGGANNAPVLSSAGSNDAEIWVTYTDSDNNQAVVAEVSIDGGAPITMSTVDHTFTDGAIYRCTTGDILAGAELDFNFTDGMATATMDYTVGIDDQKLAALPKDMELACAPNPFNPSTQISFNIDRQTDVSVDLLDIQGRHIANLIRGEMESGVHTTRLDAAKYDLSAGIYLIALNTPEKRVTEKIIYMK